MELKEKEYISKVEENKIFKPVENYNTNSRHDPIVFFAISTFAFLVILLIIFLAFTITNEQSTKIINGIYIHGINVSGMTKAQAKQTLEDYFNSSIPEELILKHNEYETSISTSNLSIDFNIDEAIDVAYNIGKKGSLLEKDFAVLECLISNYNITPGFTFDSEELTNILNDISSKLPDKVVNSSYYIDGTNLVITKGHIGTSVKISETVNVIANNINTLNLTDKIDLVTTLQSPDEININTIYEDIYKKPVDAYYTQNPYTIHPSENGLDFSISLDEAKNLLQTEQEEYIIPLKILSPNVTTNMIGSEAFPDLLSEFSTKYSPSNKNRTTNLILAANKINGTVLMPNETFSYNKTVGERTIEAGYKEAPIYVSGRVEDGIGGGICQITTTLYNAVLLANLDIVERSNHQFVPTYANASRDATVVYGVIDFKFKNNRNYPIKITCSVSNGIANFKIFGIKTDDDYDVELSSRITKTTSSAIYSEAYQTLKKNGIIINTKTISKDTYKRH